VPPIKKRQWKPQVQMSHVLHVPHDVWETYQRYHGAVNPARFLRTLLIEAAIKMRQEMAAYESEGTPRAGDNSSARNIPARNGLHHVVRYPIHLDNNEDYPDLNWTNDLKELIRQGMRPPDHDSRFLDLELTDHVISARGMFHTVPVVEPNRRSYQCLVCVVKNPMCPRVKPGDGHFLKMLEHDGREWYATACDDHAATIMELYRRTTDFRD
jgi:hypothetical protein